MESHSLLPNNNIKLEPACETDNLESSARQIISEVKDFGKMDSNIAAGVNLEQAEVYVDYTESMESHRLLPNNNIKLEPACETDSFESSTREIISEVQNIDKMDSKIAVDVKIEQPEIKLEQPEIKIEQPEIKIEQPEIYVDSAEEDMKIQPCSQSCSSLQEQSEMKRKMVFGSIDCKFVKQEFQDALCEDKHHGFSKTVDMTSCCSIQQMAGHNTESRMSVDTTLVNRQSLSLIETENGYTSSQHEHFSHMSGGMSSMIEINTKQCLTNENRQLHHVEIPVKHTQISGMSIDYTGGYTSCSPQSIQAGDTPHMSDVYDVAINEDTMLHREKTDKKPYKCDVCAVSYAHTSRLKCHMRTHTGEKPYKCDVCGASFIEADTLKRHMRTHTGEKPYKCDVCAASFTQDGTLKRHMRTHTGEKPYKCDVCGASFTQAGNQKLHMRTHTEENHKCDICGASFTGAWDMKHHMRTHAGEKPCECDVCGASFTHVGSLKRHMRTHTGEKPYKCDVCDASFTEAGNLKCHMRTHTGEKPSVCDVCGASFAQDGSLKRHMSTHKKEKPYKCDICGASFADAGYLKRHMRIHAQEKPYKCDICFVSFTQANELKRHMRIHTGEKPYMCDVCAASFTEASSLKRHMRTHKGEKP